MKIEIRTINQHIQNNMLVSIWISPSAERRQSYRTTDTSYDILARDAQCLPECNHSSSRIPLPVTGSYASQGADNIEAMT
jgi:hypothetical protein